MSIGSKDGGAGNNKHKAKTHKVNPPGFNKSHQDLGTTPNQSEGQKDGKGFSK